MDIIYNEKTYDISKDPAFIEFTQKKGDEIVKSTLELYKIVLKKFCRANQDTFYNIVKKIRNEQKIRTFKQKKVKDDKGEDIYIQEVNEYNPNDIDTSIYKYFYTWENYCLEVKNNKARTFNDQTEYLMGILKKLDVKTPKWKKYKVEKEEWYKLSKEDIQYVMNDSNIYHKALIATLLSCGLRVGDCLNLTIDQFMAGTSKFHDFVDVDEFIDNAPSDMMCYLEFKPSKTIRYDVPCRTFIHQEACNYILQMLRKIKNEYIPRKNKRDNLNLKMSKKNALFPSRKKMYMEKLDSDSVSSMFYVKNKKLYDYKLKLIKEDIVAKKLSEEDYDDAVSKIPKFHAHGLRKFFESAISENCGNIRICVLLEGHASPVKTDPSYIKKETKELEDAYIKAIPSLTLSNVKSHLLTSKETEEMQKQICSLNNEIKERDAKDKEKDKQIEDLIKENQLFKSQIEQQGQDISELKQSLHTNPSENMMMDVMNYLLEENINDEFFKTKLIEFLEKQVKNGKYDTNKLPEWIRQVKTSVSLKTEERKQFEQKMEDKKAKSEQHQQYKTKNLELLQKFTKDNNLDISDQMYIKISLYIGAKSSKLFTEEDIRHTIIKIMSEDIDEPLTFN